MIIPTLTEDEPSVSVQSAAGGSRSYLYRRPLLTENNAGCLRHLLQPLDMYMSYHDNSVFVIL